MKRLEGISKAQDADGRAALWPELGHAPERKAASPLAAVAARARIHSLEEQLAALQREHGDVRQALYAAAQMQRRLCAARDVRRGRLEISSELFAVRHIAGDFFHLQESGRTLALGAGDIAGKGITAGLWFTHMVGLLRIYANASSGPAGALGAINRHLCQFHGEPPLVALFLAALDFETGEIAYSNAGQPAPLLVRRNGSAQALREGGPLLGATEGAAFACGRTRLEPGDALIVYSDGIVECRDAAEQEFGTERLLAAARGAAQCSASKMLFSLLGAVQDFAGNHPRSDDLTLMVVRRTDRHQ
jgi:serine phosphatase RsbU (regulator of sigma subunit)